MILEYEKLKESIENGTDYSKIVPNYYEETKEFNWNRVIAFFLIKFTEQLDIKEENALRETLNELEIELTETEQGYITFSELNSPEILLNAQMIVNKYENLESLPYLIQILVTKNRYTNCHQFAIEWGAGMDYQCSLVTSLVLMANEFERADAMVHSYVVIEKNGVPFVMDPTFNLIVKKAVYDKLFQAVELTKIDNITLKDDFQYLTDQYGCNWNPKTYCLFPKEYMEEMRKKTYSRR